MMMLVPVGMYWASPLPTAADHRCEESQQDYREKVPGIVQGSFCSPGWDLSLSPSQEGQLAGSPDSASWMDAESSNKLRACFCPLDSVGCLNFPFLPYQAIDFDPVKAFFLKHEGKLSYAALSNVN